MNATRRAANRTVAVVGSLCGGVLMTFAGERAALWAAVAVFAIAAAMVALSPLRTASLEDPI